MIMLDFPEIYNTEFVNNIVFGIQYLLLFSLTVLAFCYLFHKHDSIQKN